MIDLLWSVLCYSGALVMIVGVLSVIKPVRILRMRTRGRGAAVLIGGALAVLAACLPVPSLTTDANTGSALDDFAPAFHFREHHETLIDAPAAPPFSNSPSCRLEKSSSVPSSSPLLAFAAAMSRRRTSSRPSRNLASPLPPSTSGSRKRVR